MDITFTLLIGSIMRLFMKYLVAAPLALRLISHNIRFDNRYPQEGEVLWEDRRHLLISQHVFNTRHVPTAFIGLQEVLHNQLVDILDGLNNASSPSDWSYIGVGPNDGKADGQFIPILYRSGTYTLLKSTTLWLSETPNKPSRGWDAPHWNRVVTIGEFQHKATSRKLVVMNTHFDDQGVLARKNSAQLIVNKTNEFLRSGTYQGVLLTGDFNSKPDEGAYQTMQNGTDTSFVDVVTTLGNSTDTRRHGHNMTYTGFDFAERTKKRIDYLFVAPKDNSPWTIQDYAVLESRYDDTVANSDHRMIVADLVLE